jgi:hypothetical protein
MNRIQTTQSTSKRWKGLQLLGVLGILVGVAWWAGLVTTGETGRDTALAVMVGGFLVYLLARFCAWWNHA